MLTTLEVRLGLSTYAAETPPKKRRRVPRVLKNALVDLENAILLVERLLLAGPGGTWCQCQGESDCEWCNARRAARSFLHEPREEPLGD